MSACAPLLLARLTLTPAPHSQTHCVCYRQGSRENTKGIKNPWTHFMSATHQARVHESGVGGATGGSLVTPAADHAGAVRPAASLPSSGVSPLSLLP